MGVPKRVAPPAIPVAPSSAGLDNKTLKGARDCQALRDRSLVNQSKADLRLISSISAHSANTAFRKEATVTYGLSGYIQPDDDNKFADVFSKSASWHIVITTV
jgi:hypothetical protein